MKVLSRREELQHVENSTSLYRYAWYASWNEEFHVLFLSSNMGLTAQVLYPYLRKYKVNDAILSYLSNKRFGRLTLICGLDSVTHCWVQRPSSRGGLFDSLARLSVPIHCLRLYCSVKIIQMLRC